MRRFQFLLAGLTVDQLKEIDIKDNDVLDALNNVQDWNEQQVCFDSLIFATPVKGIAIKVAAFFFV